MKAHVIAIGLAVSLLGAGGAVASSWHWAQASTKEDAMAAASAKAETKARRKGTCYKPAATLDRCRQTAEGFSCRADSADALATCVASNDWVRMPMRVGPSVDGLAPFPAMGIASSSRPQSIYPGSYPSYTYPPGVYVPPPLPSQ